MNSLYEIGFKFGTDKTTHNYLPFYERVLFPFRFDNISFLEVGIAYGESLKMWEEYFPSGMIYGADLGDKKHYETYRIKTFMIDQEIESQLMSLPGDMDFILDDGGHTMPQQQITLNALLKNKLKTGGIFILEDLHTSINPDKESCEKFLRSPTNNTLKLLEDLKNKELSKDSNFFISNKDFYELVDQIESIEILYTKGIDSVTSIIRKKV